MRTAADADRCGQDAKAAKEQWLLELRVRVHAGLGVGERNAARQPGKRRVPVDATVAGHVQEGNAGGELRLAGAVEVHRDEDLRLFGVPLDFRLTHLGGPR